MSRRSQAPTRTILPDPKFNSVLLAKFMNMVMERGKKSVAERIVYGAIDRMAEKTGRPAEQTLDLLTQALDNVKPEFTPLTPARRLSRNGCASQPAHARRESVN